MSRALAREALLYLPAKVVPALVAVVAIPLLTRLMSAEQYGQYSLALTLATIIHALVSAWLVSTALRFYVLWRDRGVARILFMLLPAVMTLGGLAYALATFLQRGRWHLDAILVAGALLTICMAAFEFMVGLLRAQSLALSYSAYVVWRAVAGFAAGVALFWWTPLNAAGIVCGLALAMLLSMPMLVLQTLRPSEWPSVAAPNGMVRELLRYGLPTAAITAASAGLTYASRFILEDSHGLAAVGVFSANGDIAEKTVFFLNSTFLLSSSVMGFKIFDENGVEAGRIFLAQLMRFYLLVAVLPVVMLAVAAPDIAALVLPPAYAEGWQVIPLVSVGALLVGVLHRYSLLMSFHKRTDFVMYSTLAGLVVNLGAGLLLMPMLGVTGAALSNLVGYAAWLAATRIMANRFQPAPFPWRVAGRIALAGLGAGLVLAVALLLPWPVLPRLLAAAAAASLAYLLLLLLTGELSPAELRRLRNPSPPASP